MDDYDSVSGKTTSRLRCGKGGYYSPITDFKETGRKGQRLGSEFLWIREDGIRDLGNFIQNGA
jgi:hypothetical protein